MLLMMKMELTVLRKYLTQMLLTMVVVAVCLTIGMQSMASLPGVVFLMLMFSMSTSESAYDEQNGWGAFRMTMPLSRRDVVLGRYALNLAVACTGALVTIVLMGALTALGSAVELPGLLAKVTAWGDGAFESTVAATISCVCIGLAMCSVTLPAYFKLGQTKATQWLPFIMMFLGVAPFLALGMIGGPLLDQFQAAIEAAGSAGGLTAIAVAAPCVALAAYAASACVSIKLYKARDL